MAEIFSRLTIVFNSGSDADSFRIGCDHLYFGRYNEADGYFGKCGIKTSFNRTQPCVESVNLHGAVLNISSLVGKFNVFSNAFLLKIPNAVAVLLEEYSEYDFKTKSAIYVNGEKTAKKDVSIKLDTLDPSTAFLLSISVAPKEIKKRFDRLDSPTSEINGVPAFWHLSAIADVDSGVRKLFPEQEMNVKCADGDSLVHYIIKNYGKDQDYALDKIFRFLFRTKDNIDVADKNGATPLMLTCACWRQSWAAKYLLDAGADFTLEDLEGRQAIHYACESNELNKLVKYLESAGADLNTVSKAGSPLWIANSFSRYGARQAFSNRGVALVAGESDYCKDPLKDLYTAIHHNDTIKYESTLSVLDIEETEIYSLLALACDYQDGPAFFGIIERFKLHPVASNIVNNRHFIDRLAFLYPSHPSTGDSLEIGLELIKNDSKDGVTKLIESREFIVNLKRLIRWNPGASVEFFSVMNKLGVDIGSIDFSSSLNLLSRLAKDLKEDKEYKREHFTLEQLFNSLVALKGLGVVFSPRDIAELNKCGIDEERLAILE